MKNYYCVLKNLTVFFFGGKGQGNLTLTSSSITIYLTVTSTKWRIMPSMNSMKV